MNNINDMNDLIFQYWRFESFLILQFWTLLHYITSYS